MLLILRIVEIHFPGGEIPTAVYQNFSAIFVIARGKRSRHAIRIRGIDHAVAKTVTFRLMFFA